MPTSETIRYGWFPALLPPGSRVAAEGEADPRLEEPAGQVDLTLDITLTPQRAGVPADRAPGSETVLLLPCAWTHPPVYREGGAHTCQRCPEAAGVSQVLLARSPLPPPATESNYPEMTARPLPCHWSPANLYNMAIYSPCLALTTSSEVNLPLSGNERLSSRWAEATPGLHLSARLPGRASVEEPPPIKASEGG